MNGQDGRKSLMREIVKGQTERIKSEFARQQGVAVTTAFDDDHAAFMYADDQILVRQEATQRVRSVLGASVVPDQGEEVVEGVDLVRFSPKGSAPVPTVLQVLEEIDQQVGPAMAAPDHILTVANGIGPESGPCPATEPEEAYFDIEPFPGVREVDDGSDGKGVRIYIADTGLLADATSHEWLAGVDGEEDPLDPNPGDLIKPYCGHGTFVAGVARCMAPAADVFVSHVFKVAGSSLESDFVKKLAAALTQGYDIFNLSVTTPSKGNLDLLGFSAWLTLVERDHPGVAVVAAAGNDGVTNKFWPAAFPQVISVGALSRDWRNRASFSNHGDWVKVYAPGRDLVNAFATGTYECQDAPYAGQIRHFYGMCTWSGTSFSTPVVSGLIAARMSSTPGLTAQKAAEALLADARIQAIPHVGPILLPYDNKFHDLRGVS